MRKILNLGLAVIAVSMGAPACNADPTNPFGQSAAGGSGNPQNQTPAATNWTTIPNQTAALNAIWGSGATDVWAVGFDNNIVHWNGTTWASAMSGTSGELRSVWGSSKDDVWAGGESGTIMHFDGAAWTRQKLPGSYNSMDYVTGIWGSGRNDVWGVGGGEFASAYVVHWDGSNWTRTEIATSASGLNAIWGSGPNDVWAVGGGTMGTKGVIVHWNGQAWSTALEGSDTVALFGMFGVWGSAANDVWAVGVQNIAHYDGTSWTLQQCSVMASQYAAGNAASLCPEGFAGVWGSGANDVWAIGNVASGGYGFIEHYNGSSWTMDEIGMLNGANGIWGSAANDVWVVGPLILQGGVILHKKP